VKRYFGSLLLRLIRGGVLLRQGEHQILSSMVAELPDHLRSSVENQFAEYNLVQREVDGRALNFYKMSLFSAKPLQVRAALHGKRQDLIRVSASAPGEAEPIHATLKVVAGRAFCASFNRPAPELSDGRPLMITKVTHAWQSEFPARSDA
jgi:hypothetical protein